MSLNGRPTVVVTGATGNLGRGVVEALDPAVYRVVRSDVTGDAGGGDFRPGDARLLDDMRRVMSDPVDILVHCPAWHGVHFYGHSDHDYWQLNVDGTFNALTAAVEAGCRRVVWASSAVFYGPVGNKYSFSKHVGELVLDHFREREGVSSVRLRFGNFTPPQDFLEYGLRFLAGGSLDRRDAAGAAARAVAALLDGSIQDSWFDVLADSVFSAEDASGWREEPWTVLARHYPERVELLRRNLEGRLPGHLDASRPADRMRAELGYAPRFNFDTFVDELVDRDARGDLSAPPGYSISPL